MNAFRSTADMAHNAPESYSILSCAAPDLGDDSELIVIDAEPVTPTPAEITAMHAERPNDLDLILVRFADLADGLEALADHVDTARPQARINAYLWAAAQVRRVLAEVKT